MRPLGTLGWVALCSAAATACGSSASLDEPRAGTSSAAIQGGSVDDQDTAIVNSVNYDHSAICTASLIAPNVILTAKHCLAEYTADCSADTHEYDPTSQAARIHVASAVSWTSGQYEALGREIRTPAGNGAGCDSDIAVVILDHNLPQKPMVPRIDVPVSSSETYSAVGYGETCWGCNDPGTRRRLNGLQVVDTSDPLEWQGGHNTCRGDSGGPAIDTQGRVIGVVFAPAVNSTCGVMIYTRVDPFKDMIVKAVTDGAAIGGYDVPSWAKSGKTDGVSSGAAGSAGVAGSGGDGGGAGGSGGGGSRPGGAGATGAAGSPASPVARPNTDAQDPSGGAGGSNTTSAAGSGGVANVDVDPSPSDQAPSDEPSAGPAPCAVRSGPLRDSPRFAWLIGLSALALHLRHRRRTTIWAQSCVVPPSSRSNRRVG